MGRNVTVSRMKTVSVGLPGLEGQRICEAIA